MHDRHRTENIHYERPEHYAGKKPYRDFLILAMEHFGKRPLREGELWTLGGSYSYEYDYLVENGAFPVLPASYHSVDRKDFGRRVAGVVYHPNTEFADIKGLWRDPRIVAWDATIGLTNSSYTCWDDIVHLMIDGLKKSGDLLLVANVMADWAGIKWKSADDWDVVLGDWLSGLVGRIEWEGFSCEILPNGLIAPKEGSQTNMVAVAVHGCKIN